MVVPATQQRGTILGASLILGSSERGKSALSPVRPRYNMLILCSAGRSVGSGHGGQAEVEAETAEIKRSMMIEIAAQVHGRFLFCRLSLLLLAWRSRRLVMKEASMIAARVVQNDAIGATAAIHENF